ncbi:MAG: RICIN domain-containing protein [Fibrobacter sp.]|nr:RICIN domain-containing protein [Fibrobacter sp.]
MGRYLGVATWLAAAGLTFAATYPVNYVRFGMHDSNRNLNISGMSSGSPLNTWITNGVKNEAWQIEYVEDGVYKIKNAATGRYVTADGDTARLADEGSAATQNWKIEGVEKDFIGQNLYYKVTNASSGKALNFNSAGNSVTLATYSGKGEQKWRLDLNGLEGFAANAKVDEGIKAGTIGGLLGKTVFASTNEQLKNYLNAEEPLTIVLTANLDFQKEGTVRVRDNKTLIGSYEANTLSDIQLQNNAYGYRASKDDAVYDPASDNIVIMNLDFEVVNVKDRIVVSIYSGKNVWIDHNSFISKLTNSVTEVGKFVWVNTPYNASDMKRSPDFVTVSYNIMKNRYWTLVYGTQNGVTKEDRTSVMFNVFEGCVRRLPEIGNGSAHVYSNYYNRTNTSVENDPIAGIIIDNGASGYVESNRFEGHRVEPSGYTDFVIMCGGRNMTQNDNYTNQSKTGASNVTPYLWTSTDSYTTPAAASWFTPSKIYGYNKIKSYDPSGAKDAKAFDSKYSGAQKNKANFIYITDYEMADWRSASYAAPFLANVTTTEAPKVESSSSVAASSSSETIVASSSSEAIVISSSSQETTISSSSEETAVSSSSEKNIDSSSSEQEIASSSSDNTQGFVMNGITPKISVVTTGLQVQISAGRDGRIQLFDSMGHIIATAQIVAGKVSMNVRAPGRYFVRALGKTVPISIH